MSAHFELLLRWNKVLNLSAIRSKADIVERHYCESLFLAATIPPRPMQIADLGSGAGFPGIPLAIFRPDSAVWLVESHRRKSVFLREAARDIANVRVLSQRAEDVTEMFDCVVSRAVSLPNLQDWLVRHAGLVAFLGGAEPPLLSEFDWNAPIRMPWGDHRYVYSGRNVSRETLVCDIGPTEPRP
ncbi:MAG: 16S rRNA (guanine(527)-N(7))-methyltransferase RsmG [Acidobacteriota bacterium]|nr:16S rRNA (guanine(527)-N(7))-methyltransferase RsmG [Acidobacteriota bacterium]